jgi:hypothetical protein
MSTLVTSMPSDLSYLFDTNRFASLQGRIRGSRARKLAAPPKFTFALMSTPVDSDLDDPSEGQQPSKISPTVSQDIVSLLSSDKDLTNTLILFTSAYGSVTAAFSDIFSFPFLDNLEMPTLDPTEGNDTTNADPPLTSRMTTRQVLLDGNGSFHNFCDFEVQTCRNLIGYANLLSVLLKQQSPSSCVSTITIRLTLSVLR